MSDNPFWRIRNRARIDGKLVTIGSEEVRVVFEDNSGNVLLATGTTVPTGGTAGYAKGGQFIDTDEADGNKGLYENVGTTSSCNFNKIGDITGAEIGDGAITLAKLASGITPSHIVKFAGKVTWTGGGVTKAETVTGVVTGDIVIATIQTKPSEAAYFVGAVPTTDTITFELSVANTSNDAVISYIVLNAAA